MLIHMYSNSDIINQEFWERVGNHCSLITKQRLQNTVDLNIYLWTTLDCVLMWALPLINSSAIFTCPSWDARCSAVQPSWILKDKTHLEKNKNKLHNYVCICNCHNPLTSIVNIITLAIYFATYHCAPSCLQPLTSHVQS